MVILSAATAPPQLVSMSHALYGRGWMEGTSGNLSVLAPGDRGRALITASGRAKHALTARDIVAVTVADGRPVDPGGPRPSAETAIHTALYRSVKDCAAVIHAHSPHATALASLAGRRGEEALRLADYELIKGLDVEDPRTVDIPVFPNWPDVPQIGSDVAAYAGRAGWPLPPVLLIAHHGATVWGPDLETARNRLECLEALCHLVLLTHRHR
ncbi:methylthioribulose-1-phosphate dehydratase [Kitasatospora sp. MAP12-15]|uniref:methylthioribulose 1-phosphate dehydratase n=1 Tax=unclassified Kitasatospora TaxID=2633591 RepID=UPI002475BC88|nr:methylthioribulose 1-phosphate dehydratase [Kitasatospora sp. MAP12-44]MDH6109382.1 methylthioribulose-1-phosphate dehydratase [Kitasatospora sp. MAP12-44]